MASAWRPSSRSASSASSSAPRRSATTAASGSACGSRASSSSSWAAACAWTARPGTARPSSCRCRSSTSIATKRRRRTTARRAPPSVPNRKFASSRASRHPRALRCSSLQYLQVFAVVAPRARGAAPPSVHANFRHGTLEPGDADGAMHAHRPRRVSDQRLRSVLLSLFMSLSDVDFLIVFFYFVVVVVVLPVSLFICSGVLLMSPPTLLSLLLVEPLLSRLPAGGVRALSGVTPVEPDSGCGVVLSRLLLSSMGAFCLSALS